MTDFPNPIRDGNDEMTTNQTTSYDPDYFEPLALAEERHFWFRSRNRLISLFLKGLKEKFTHQSHIIEIGCGTGNVLRAINEVFPESSVLGMDMYRDGLIYAKKKVSSPLVQGDLHMPPFSTQFGVIGLFDVLEHIEDDTLVLDDLYRMLELNGYLILTVPAFSSLWSYFDVAGHHVRRYHKEDLNQKLEGAGFKVIQSSYFMSVLFPIVWLRRKLAGKRTLTTTNSDAVYDQTVEELTIIPVINEILVWVLGIENRLIRQGLQMPFGSSLIAVAKKFNTVEQLPIVNRKY